MGENLEFTRNLREIYEKKTSEVDLGVVKDKGGGEQFLNMIIMIIIIVCHVKFFEGNAGLYPDCTSMSRTVTMHWRQYPGKVRSVWDAFSGVTFVSVTIAISDLCLCKQC